VEQVVVVEQSVLRAVRVVLSVVEAVVVELTLRVVLEEEDKFGFILGK
jgi:hypothetical protein